MKPFVFMFVLSVFVASVFAQSGLPEKDPNDPTCRWARGDGSYLGGYNRNDSIDRDRETAREADRIEREWHVYCLKGSRGEPAEFRPDCKKGVDGLCIDTTMAKSNKNASPFTVGTLFLGKMKNFFASVDKDTYMEVSRKMDMESPWASLLLERSLEKAEKQAAQVAARQHTDIAEIDPNAKGMVMACVRAIDPGAKVSFPHARYVGEGRRGGWTGTAVHIEWNNGRPSPAAMECLETGDPSALAKEIQNELRKEQERAALRAERSGQAAAGRRND